MHCGLGPFASPRAGAILSMVFCFFVFLPPILTSLCPGTGLGVSARFQLLYTIFSWPFQQTNQRVRLRSPRHAMWRHPSPWIATHAIHPSFGLPRMPRLWRLIIHFLAPSTFFLCVYSVGGLVSCMLWYPPHTFLCPEWWSTNERGLKRNLTGTGIKPSPTVNVIFLHHWHSQPPGSPEPRRVSPNCSASKKGVSSRFVMKTPWKMTGNMSSMMCLL